MAIVSTPSRLGKKVSRRQFEMGYLFMDNVSIDKRGLRINISFHYENILKISPPKTDLFFFIFLLET